MAGATRKGLPRCEEMVIKYDNRKPVGMGPCGKPAVAQYFYRAISNIPTYVCEWHDKELLKLELQDEDDREERDARQDNL